MNNMAIEKKKANHALSYNVSMVGLLPILKRKSFI